MAIRIGCAATTHTAQMARGQFIIVMPDQNAVVAMTADTPRMQDELNLVWKYVLPVLDK